MSVRKRSILIDTDTASDDAVALIMALRSTAVTVEAVTVVAGNVAVEQGSRNALYAVELCGASVPVFAGAAQPLTRNLELAHWFHGHDGLGDHGYAPRITTPQSEHAVDALIRIVKCTPGIEIITLGPLTNLALALAQEPSIASKISRCVVMGGAPACEGNVTPAAEFNIWVDPEAAQRVFRSRLPIELVGWQLSRGSAVLDSTDMAQIDQLATRAAEFALRCNSKAAEAFRKQTGEIGIALPDPVAMAVLLEPSICLSSSRHYIDIEIASPLTRGMTVVDRLRVASDERNRETWQPVLDCADLHTVCWEIDVTRWKALLLDALR